jgi:hypothetical protein
VKYSLFAPKGLHQYKGGRPLAQALHETALALFAKHTADEGSLSTEPGSLVDLFCFMLALAFARIARTNERADGERHALGAYHLLAQFEGEYDLRPGADDTLGTRRGALAEAKLLPRGNTRAELEQQLRDLLGADYIGMHIPAIGDVEVWPADLGDQPQLLLEATAPRKLVRIVKAVASGLGAPKTMQYTAVDPQTTDDEPQVLAVGDQLVVEPEILHRAEVVEVTAVGFDADDNPTFTGTFNQAHEPNALATQMPFPAWTSTQRTILIALETEAAVDPEVRRRAHEKLGKIATGVTVWELCGMSSETTIGPWTIGDPRLGMIGHNPIGTITVT